MSAPCCVICYEMGCDKCTKNTERAFFGQSKNRFFNLMCAPFALVGHSLYSFLWTCLYVYIQRLVNHLCCFACVHFGFMQGCYKYKDRRFKPNDTSLGKNAEEAGLEWRRASDIVSKPVLFQKDVDPSDVKQGNLGNCWLLSSFACMAEFPSLVDKVFVNRELSTRGKYQVWLYNGYSKKWQLITVDEFLPVKKIASKTLEHSEEVAGDVEKGETEAANIFEFARPVGNELWVPILEKAFAKFRGSYKNLSGGNMIYAFQCLTGDNVFRLGKVKDDPKREGVWERFILADDVRPEDIDAIKVKKTGHSLRPTDLFDMLRTYDRSKALVGASVAAGPNGEESVDEKTGLISGHAYSVIACKRVGKEKFELVKLRNPWGHFEWKGDWSDSSEKWTQHPEVADALEHQNNVDDGTFWMPFDSFAQMFDNIDICDRTINFKDFHLNVHENPTNALMHCFGPTQGCLEGCFNFWVRCRGIRYLYCGNESIDTMKKTTRKKKRDDTVLGEISAAI